MFLVMAGRPRGCGLPAAVADAVCSLTYTLVYQKLHHDRKALIAAYHRRLGLAPPTGGWRDMDVGAQLPILQGFSSAFIARPKDYPPSCVTVRAARARDACYRLRWYTLTQRTPNL